MLSALMVVLLFRWGRGRRPFCPWGSSWIPSCSCGACQWPTQSSGMLRQGRTIQLKRKSKNMHIKSNWITKIIIITNIAKICPPFRSRMINSLLVVIGTLWWPKMPCPWQSCLTWNALSHDGEGDPGSDFVGVVGAGDELEEEGEGIVGGVWDLAN